MKTDLFSVVGPSKGKVSVHVPWMKAEIRVKQRYERDNSTFKGNFLISLMKDRHLPEE